MTRRFSYAEVAPEAYKAMLGLEGYLHGCGLERSLLELIKVRASQINGCAFCLDMHTKDARALGETEERLYLLTAWDEAPFYTERERAALAYAEALTLVAEQGVSDALYEELRAHFREEEIVGLTFAIATINAWNRLSIASGAEPGHYRSKATP